MAIVIGASGARRTLEASEERGVEWLRCALGLEKDQTPFPWQVELLRRFLRGEVVASLDIPTGLGKTATMAIWLVARALGAALPRRLVYVVDRRAVVDQATEVAEALRVWVRAEREVAHALGLGGRSLPISTLRGQHVDNREWLEDPSAPAIVVGTVDMVGSRLLFSGYGVSSKMRPYHAGLFGADALVVLDEAHLVPPLEALLRRIESGADAFGPKDPTLRRLIPRFVLLSLSATGRFERSTALGLTEADHVHPIVRRRLDAPKGLTTVTLTPPLVTSAESASDTGDSGKENKNGSRRQAPKLASRLAECAWELTEKGSRPVRCIVFCNARKDAVMVADALRGEAKSARAPEPTVELFVGARRVRERAQARDALARLGFLAGASCPLERAVFLVATSAGEVGVDLDADHMVCDLVPWERMVQRFGRVNRRGERKAEVIVVVESEPAPADAVKKALERRDAAKQGAENLSALKKKLCALQDEKTSRPKGKKKTNEEKHADESRKRAEKELKDAIKKSGDCIKAFKDADAKVAVQHEREHKSARALRMLLAAIGEGGSLSPGALIDLKRREELAEAFRDATTVDPLRPELTRALVEAWSMTSLEDHPGRPDVGPWVRGWTPNDPPQTILVWRRHLPVRAGAFDPKAARRFFEAAPLHASERLETETHDAVEWLLERAKRTVAAEPTQSLEAAPLRETSTVAIALTSRGQVKASWTLEGLRLAKDKEGKKAKADLKESLVGTTLVVDARLGGLSDGLLDERKAAPAEAADDGEVLWLERVGARGVSVVGFRVTPLHGDADEGERASSPTPEGAHWVRRLVFVVDAIDGEPVNTFAVDGWEGESATEDDRAEATRPQELDVHQSWAEQCARDIVDRVGLEGEWASLVALAARLHDEGKRAPRWQRAFKVPADGRVYAKARGPIDFALLDGYRHELGSLPYAEKDERIKTLPPDAKDLVLHLIATHHGYGRPAIGTTGCDDAPPSVVEGRAREIALRFARLSRQWGPWGLAWLEALMRAADQAASRQNQAEAMVAADKEQP